MGMVLDVGVLGDASANGSVSALDASLILQFVVGTTGAEQHAALVPALSDVSAMGGITSYDAALVLRYVAGLLDWFPVQGYEAGLVRPAASAGQTYTAGFGTPTMDGDLFVLPVSADHLTGVEAGRLEVHLPGTVGTLESVRTPGSAGIVAHAQDGDVLHIAFADPLIASDKGGSVVELLIRAHGDDLTGAVRLADLLLNEADNTVVLGKTEASLADALPLVAEIGPNAPNPFNPATTVPYSVPFTAQYGLDAVPTTLSVYSIAGQLVATLVDESMAPGRYKAVWAGNDLQGRSVGSGVYIATLRSGGQVQITRMVLVR